MKEHILGLLLSIPAVIWAISIHEYAHALAAYKMGDPTAKNMGRLTLNPLAHFDIFGTLCMLIARFGWAKPVPVNPRNFKNIRRGNILVSAAGPAANFISAMFFAFLLAITGKFLGFQSFNQVMYVSGLLFSSIPSGMTGVALLLPMLYYCVLLNIGFMTFNLIPLPPLDGSKILFEFLPYKYREYFYRVERYSFIIMILIITSNALSPILRTVVGWMLTLINMIFKYIY